MYEGQRVAAVVPALNEAAHIGDVLRRMPGCVDHIIVVDDGSTDRTLDFTFELQHQLRPAARCRL